MLFRSVHELIDTRAHKRPADHHVAPNHKVNLREKPYDTRHHLQHVIYSVYANARREESTEEACGRKSRVRDEGDVFGEVDMANGVPLYSVW